MAERYFVVNMEPKKWQDNQNFCSAQVSRAPWERGDFFISGLLIKGRKSWLAPEPKWQNEVIYYNLMYTNLESILDTIVVHHTNNSKSVLDNEKKHQAQGYAALGYHFFINKKGEVFEGRPLEIMGSNAGAGKLSGPINDPDWGAIGIVLQGDYHHNDDWINSESVPKTQLETLKNLVVALKNKYAINHLIMHKETTRSGKETVCPGDHLAPKVESIRSELLMLGKK